MKSITKLIEEHDPATHDRVKATLERIESIIVDALRKSGAAALEVAYDPEIKLPAKMLGGRVERLLVMSALFEMGLSLSPHAKSEKYPQYPQYPDGYWAVSFYPFHHSFTRIQRTEEYL